MKFTTPNIVVANPIPDETKIYFSKGPAFYGMCFTVVPLIIGSFFLFNGIDYLPGTLIFFLIALGVFYWKFKIFTNNAPQIILSKEGIQTAYKPFYTWNQITQIDVDSMWGGRGSTKYYLVYKTPNNEKAEVQLNGLNIDEKDFKTLLNFYSLQKIK